ncbi:hypothetical protein [Rubinisphaera italica]|nr:hypothetical protein [Rubinisphaera italica]
MAAHELVEFCTIRHLSWSIVALRSRPQTFEILTGGDATADRDSESFWLDPDDIGRSDGTDYVPLPTEMLEHLRVNLGGAVTSAPKTLESQLRSSSPFHTVIPARNSKEKIHKIEFLGGTCHLVDDTEIETAAGQLTRELNGHYMDQFTYAERANDWRGNNNIADSPFRQMSCERHSEPTWVVMSAGTGGTSDATSDTRSFRPDCAWPTQTTPCSPNSGARGHNAHLRHSAPH